MLNKTFKYTEKRFFESNKQPSTISVYQVLLVLCIVSGVLTLFLE